ncbi:MAG: putative Na+/H+ antiporter [Bacteriovoracaceae bacterium]|nr:putative Na+/H+ antiporter [Bacteriovoracaceae bacterium]
MENQVLLIGSTVIFAISLIHSFMSIPISNYSQSLKEDSIKKNLLHYFGEVESIFGIWALVFIIFYSFVLGPSAAVAYVSDVNYTEPLFVFVIMIMASARPVLKMAEQLILKFANVLPFEKKMSFYVSALILGPLLGSFITEPAAMTLVSMILLHKFFRNPMTPAFKFATVGLLFVNISIGGTLTHFAAPPVVMVAGKWGWDTLFMLSHFGYKTIISLILSTGLYAFIFKRELRGKVPLTKERDNKANVPLWLSVIHIVFLVLVIMTAHHPKFFISIFIFYLGFLNITLPYQEAPRIQSGLMVGFFLAALVTLGKLQAWWLQPLIQSLSDFTLYLSATGLTGITDNAALTYLGSLVDLSDSAKYALVAGAVTGGGLTVIANAPNPAGYTILKDTFKYGISPLKLFFGALIPTIITILCYQFLPSFSF